MIGSIYVKFDKAVVGENGDITISFIAPKNKRLPTYTVLDTLLDRELRLDVYLDKPRRSLSANAYFHTLVSKIALSMRLGMDEVKYKMVIDYGTPHLDEQGNSMIVKVLKGKDIRSIYEYSEWVDTITENNTEYDCHILYKPTHLLDSREMWKLLEGTTHEASELGIETLEEIQVRDLLKKMED